LADQLKWETKDSLEDIKIILAKILRRWYWIVIVLVLSLTVAYLYIRYQDPVYIVRASFISRKFDDRTVNLVPRLTELGFSESIEVYQQIPLLKSENRIYETLERLDFDISYFVEGRLKTTELYQSSPYVVVSDDSSGYIPYNQKIYLDKVNDRQYRLSTETDFLNQRFSDKTFLFGVEQNVNDWQFVINKDNGNGINPDYRYYFVIHDPRSLMSKYRSRLDIQWAERGSAILNTSISSEIPEKDYNFLTTYLKVIIDFGLAEKQEYLVNSIDFMNSYMGEVADSIVNYQNQIDQFRLTNRDVISGSTLVIDKLSALEEEKANLLLEMSYYDYLKDYIEEHRTEEVFAPNLIGLEVPPLEDLINNYMEVKWEDQVSKNEFNNKNPLVNKQNEEFDRIEKNIYESIINLKQLNTEKSNELEKQINFYLRSIDKLQVEYRMYVGMERMLAIYEELYNQLLTRKTDANISMASLTSDYQMVTEPFYSSIPIYPDKDKSYIISLLLGLGLPIGLILLIDYINPRVISKEDLKRHTNIPVIGSVGHFKGKTNLVVSHKPKSQVSEAFRVIRANLEYIDAENKDTRIILVTSSISGEGKTFCSANLALTYAKMGKKTILIGADMRKPALSRNFNLERAHGLSNYLSGQDAIEDIIYASGEEDAMDVIPGGHVPPNPSELLTSKRMPELMEFVRKHYEVVIFDTPPIGLVSDTMELIRHSFTPLLIVRQGVSYKKSLDAITEMYQAGKIKNLGIIMNDIHYYKYDYGAYYGRNYGYGSGSGYGYYDDENKRGFWKRIFHS
jgi:capsular exopolysaccharide synthesis family protein